MNKAEDYAGFWKRLIADFIDSTLLDICAFLTVLIWLGILYTVKSSQISPGSEPLTLTSLYDPMVAQILIAASRGSFAFFYYVWGTYRYGTTLGKRLFRIYVISDSSLSQPSSETPAAEDLPWTPVTLKQSIQRCLGYLASYLPLGGGFLMILFHPQRKGLHDWLSGTVSVVREQPEEV